MPFSIMGRGFDPLTYRLWERILNSYYFTNKYAVIARFSICVPANTGELLMALVDIG